MDKWISTVPNESAGGPILVSSSGLWACTPVNRIANAMAGNDMHLYRPRHAFQNVPRRKSIDSCSKSNNSYLSPFCPVMYDSKCICPPL